LTSPLTITVLAWTCPVTCALDRHVALDVDVALEAARDPDVACALDLAFDRDVSRDQRLLRIRTRGRRALALARGFGRPSGGGGGLLDRAHDRLDRRGVAGTSRAVLDRLIFPERHGAFLLQIRWNTPRS
jgi:hypothetical protein